MKKCASCGNTLREGSDFCPACGASTSGKPRATADGSAPTTDVPLITLAPQQNTFSRQRVIRYIKMAIGIILVIVLALGAALTAAWVSSNAYKQSNFEEVQNDKYRQCLALVDDVRNDNFNDYVESIINMDGDAANYNFLSEYEKLFKTIVPNDGSTETEIMFRNCCYMVSYAEFVAKKFEMLSEKAIIGSFYLDKADKFRGYANELYTMLCEADTDAELQEIIDFCADNDIIYLE